MRFMMIVHGPEDFGNAGPPPQALMDAIGKLGEEAFKSGKMVSMGGLFHSAKGARIRQRGGKLVTTDGPFTEAKEVVGGFSIMELSSKAEAIQEARKFMELHQKHWPQWEGECEIRQMYEEGQQPEF
ncbi:MAG TPA: YciI family protein [Gemmatimonadaceae bacterium]|jgi:hypothetical protein|nr:YciI family protein [Gemmatimonadaceae bacterium]